MREERIADGAADGEDPGGTHDRLVLQPDCHRIGRQSTQPLQMETVLFRHVAASSSEICGFYGLKLSLLPSLRPRRDASTNRNFDSA
jgi:hypothetical protein